MLSTLRIRDLVIIEDLTVEFGPGLNLLTGETGAGKSILVDAVGLVLGQRADRSMVRKGADKIVVEALFDVESGSRVREWLLEQGALDPDDPDDTDGAENGDEPEQVIVRREVSASGSGRVFVNGSPVTAGQLRELGSCLLELHGQHEQQHLLSPEQHLALLDRFGGDARGQDAVSRTYGEVVAVRHRRSELRRREADRGERIAELQRIVEEIDGAAPRQGERDELEVEAHKLRNAATLIELVDELVRLCHDGEPDVASMTATAARKAAELAELDPEQADAARRLSEAAVELQDLGASFRDYRQHCAFLPGRLEEVEERRALLDRLCQIHGADEAAVLLRADEARLELDALGSLSRELEELDAAVRDAERSYADAAAKLSRSRRRAAKRLTPEVETQLGALALPRAQFGVDFPAARGTAVESGKGEAIPLNSRGAERAEFQLAANPGEPARPLAKVASGGELSRIMLALHAVLDDASERRALIFDEVDSGIGGAVADAVGARLAGLARNRQVLCVTHLPQVAAYADQHHVVRKLVVNGRTRAEIISLTNDQRVDELARMLGGKRITQVSRQHASELLDAAGRSRRRA